jgi:Flp pilus assembly protein TadB
VRFYGEKLLFGMLGLVMVPVLSVLLSVLGWRLPAVVPVVVTLGLAVGMFFLPDYNVRDDAKRARTEFARALGAYADLVALERHAGSGPRQALEVAAGVGASWVFRRLREELAFSSWSGEQPWQALRRLSQELGVPELGTWLTSCGSAVKRGPRSTPSCGHGPRRCGPRCSPTKSPTRTPSGRSCRSR